MEKKKLKERVLPPGFSDADFEPINIKSVRKTKKGFEIEIKADIEKEPGVTYTYKLIKGSFKILRNNKSIKTPGGKIVSTPSESLAKRIADHMNIYGEEYTMAYSVVTFVYSYIDFYENCPKEELVDDILNALRGDWTLDCPYNGERDVSRWVKTFGFSDDRHSEFAKWVEDLTNFQLGGLVVMSYAFSSVNTGYILSHFPAEGDLREFAIYYDKSWAYSQKKMSMGLSSYWPVEDMLKVFDNYIFCYKTGI
ncbi:MAG: hypothetical protein JXN62_13260 [Bacteroidales bacterium]|nr:hypothetical protein [Bacteroidales bacterium]